MTSGQKMPKCDRSVGYKAARPLIAAASLAVALAASVPPARAQSAAAGAAEFRRSCAACHATGDDNSLAGPGLSGVVGRVSGTIKSYRYSPALRGARLTWDRMKLDLYIAEPQKAVPGTRMEFAGIKDPATRADVIAFLATLR
jgi:cytochrome c